MFNISKNSDTKGTNPAIKDNIQANQKSGPKVCQKVSYTAISGSKYQVAIQKTYDNFYQYYKIEMESWFILCDDDDLKEFFY